MGVPKQYFSVPILPYIRVLNGQCYLFYILKKQIGEQWRMAKIVRSTLLY